MKLGCSVNGLQFIGGGQSGSVTNRFSACKYQLFQQAVTRQEEASKASQHVGREVRLLSRLIWSSVGYSGLGEKAFTSLKMDVSYIYRTYCK